MFAPPKKNTSKNIRTRCVVEMVKCVECGEEIPEGEEVIECNLCGKPVCRECVRSPGDGADYCPGCYEAAFEAPKASLNMAQKWDKSDAYERFALLEDRAWESIEDELRQDDISSMVKAVMEDYSHMKWKELSKDIRSLLDTSRLEAPKASAGDYTTWVGDEYKVLIPEDMTGDVKIYKGERFVGVIFPPNEDGTFGGSSDKDYASGYSMVWPRGSDTIRLKVGGETVDTLHRSGRSVYSSGAEWAVLDEGGEVLKRGFSTEEEAANWQGENEPSDYPGWYVAKFGEEYESPGTNVLLLTAIGALGVGLLYFLARPVVATIPTGSESARQEAVGEVNPSPDTSGTVETASGMQTMTVGSRVQHWQGGGTVVCINKSVVVIKLDNGKYAIQASAPAYTDPSEFADVVVGDVNGVDAMLCQWLGQGYITKDTKDGIIGCLGIDSYC